MKSSISGASANQVEIIEAFLTTRATNFFLNSIQLIKSNSKSFDHFHISATRNNPSCKINYTTDASIRWALNAIETWFVEESSPTFDFESAPAFQFRGVIEGFYGAPWTQAERLRGVTRFADFGMNLFMIAPKDSPWQRFNWRLPFAEDFLSEMKKLVDAGRVNCINVSSSVSPGLSVSYSDLADVAAVAFRFEQLMDIGMTHIGLLYDDIPWELQTESDIKKYSSTALAHADFANQVYQRLLKKNANVVMTVCPMHYSGRGPSVYLQELGEVLDSRINLMWTGRQICSEYLDISDALIFKNDTKRAPFYWDNFPVNDGSMAKSLHIAPIQGREVGLENHSIGLLSNPMTQFELSLIPVSTIGDYLWNSKDYNPEISWERGLRRLIQNESDRLAARKVLRCSLGSCLGGDPAPDLRRVFNTGITAWRKGELEVSAKVFEDEAKSMIAAANQIESSRYSMPSISRELAPWLIKFKVGAEVLAGLGAVIRKCTFNSEMKIIRGTAKEITRLHELREILEEPKKNLFGDQLAGPMQELITELSA